MVDLLMNKMSTMMDKKLEKQEKISTKKLQNVQKQVGAVANATQECINELKKR